MNTNTQPWYVITERNQKTSQLLEEAKALFPVWTWQDFEKFDKDFPIPKSLTTREFKPNIEADEEHKNKSADDLEKQGVQGITLRERIIMEIQYFKETGDHLDLDNITLCAGSRRVDGDVPYAYWDVSLREFCVIWCRVRFASGNLRVREVVSNPSTLNLDPLKTSGIYGLNERVKVLEDKMSKTQPTPKEKWIEEFDDEFVTEYGELTDSRKSDNNFLKPEDIKSFIHKGRLEAVEEYKRKLREKIKGMRGADDDGRVEFVKQIVLKLLDRTELE